MKQARLSSKKIIVLIVISSLLAILSIGSNSFPTPKVDEPDTIEGLIVSGFDQKPVSDRTVYLVAWENYPGPIEDQPSGHILQTTVADQQGHFVFHGIRGGNPFRVAVYLGLFAAGPQNKRELRAHCVHHWQLLRFFQFELPLDEQIQASIDNFGRSSPFRPCPTPGN